MESTPKSRHENKKLYETTYGGGFQSIKLIFFLFNFGKKRVFMQFLELIDIIS